MIANNKSHLIMELNLSVEQAIYIRANYKVYLLRPMGKKAPLSLYADRIGLVATTSITKLLIKEIFKISFIIFYELS